MEHAVVEVKKLRPSARLPFSGSSGAAGYDFYACLEGDGEVNIAPRHNVKIPTGIALAIPVGCFGAVFPRSGLSTKEGLRLANCVGVIDSDYRGECFIPLYNDSETEKIVRDGDRIAQLILLPYLPIHFVLTDVLSETERGEKGFGSTGI